MFTCRAQSREGILSSVLFEKSRYSTRRPKFPPQSGLLTEILNRRLVFVSVSEHLMSMRASVEKCTWIGIAIVNYLYM